MERPSPRAEGLLVAGLCVAVSIVAILVLAPETSNCALWVPPVFAVAVSLTAGLFVTTVHKRRESNRSASSTPNPLDDAPKAPGATSETVSIPKPESRPKSEKHQPSPSAMSILVAEDNLINRRVAELLLKKLGQDADFAGNGAEAVDACRRTAYDLILMDIRMPEKDGHVATRDIRALEAERKERTPAYICAVTADDMDGVRERALESGMDGFLPKPVNLDELSLVLRKASLHRLGSQ